MLQNVLRVQISYPWLSNETMDPHALGPLANYTIRLLASVIDVLKVVLAIALAPAAGLLLSWLAILALALYLGLQVVGGAVWLLNMILGAAEPKCTGLQARTAPPMPSDKQAPAARYENEPNSLSRKAAHSQSTVTPCASPPNGSLPNPGSCEAAGQAPATSELAAAAADSTRKEQQQAPVRDSSKDKDIAIRTMVTPSSPEALQVTSSCPEYGATTTPDDCATVADATAILHMGHQDHKIATEGTSDCKLEGHGERADADTDDYVKQQDQKEAPNAQAAACGNQPVTYIGEEEGALIARAVAQLDAQAQKADKELRNMDFAGRDLWFQARAAALQIPEAEMMIQRVEFEQKCIKARLAAIILNLKLHTRMAC